MTKNLHNLGRFLALVIMTALALRPVVVSAQTVSYGEKTALLAHSASLSGHQADDHAFAKAGSFSPFRALQKEKQDPSPLGPCVSRPVVLHTIQAALPPRFLQSCGSFLRTVQVLRI